jgi:hypothetical protein
MLQDWGEIDYGQPVARGHPLNRGLVSWWLAVPWYMSGPRFIDLAGRSHGTLTNGTTWQGARGRPGGWGALTFDGTNDHVAVPDRAETGLFTVSAWARSTSTSGTRGVFTRSEAVAFTQNWMLFQRDATGLFWSFQTSDGSSNEARSTIATTDGVWRQLVGVYSGSGALTLYVDGKLAASNSGSSPGMNGFSVTSIGSYASGSSDFWQGDIDDVKLWSGRALSSDDVAQLYRLSVRGYPGVLNRISRVAYFVDTGAGADPEGSLVGGKLIRGGLLLHGVLGR